MTAAMQNLMRLVSHPGTFGETCEFVVMANGGLSIAPCGADLLPDEARRIQLDPDQVIHLMARLDPDPNEVMDVATEIMIQRLTEDHIDEGAGALALFTGLVFGGIFGLVMGGLLF